MSKNENSGAGKGTSTASKMAQRQSAEAARKSANAKRNAANNAKKAQRMADGTYNRQQPSVFGLSPTKDSHKSG